MTVLPRQQEHAHSAHVCSNRSIFGFTLNLFILIIQHAVAFRAAVQHSTWATAVLNPSKSTALATNLSCVCRSLLYKTTGVWITLQGDGWKEPCQTPPGALSRKIHYAFISWISASHQENAFWCQGLVLPFGKRDLCTHTFCQPHRFQNKLRGHLAQFSLLWVWHWIGLKRMTYPLYDKSQPVTSKDAHWV